MVASDRLAPESLPIQWERVRVSAEAGVGQRA
jgi:hypothetical protein